MKVSVIVPTFRLGGIDCLKWSLDQQVYLHENIELVLVDGLYEYRAEQVANYFKGVQYTVKHLPPKKLSGEAPVFPRDCHPRYRNTGLEAATGDLCVLWCDYVMATGYVIAQFVHRQTTVGENFGICGTHVYSKVDKRLLDVRLAGAYSEQNKGPRYLFLKDIDTFLEFLGELPKHDPLWVTAFQLGLEETYPHLLNGAFLADLSKQDPKLRMISGSSIAAVALHMKNEAVMRKHLLNVGGLDETYNDTKCADDLDLGLRLAVGGLRFTLDKGIDVLVPDPHDFTPILRRTWTHEEALKEWEDVRKPAIMQGDMLPRKSILLSSVSP